MKFCTTLRWREMDSIGSLSRERQHYGSPDCCLENGIGSGRGTEGSNPSPSAIKNDFISIVYGLTHKYTRTNFVDVGGPL
jgi:hypothetical protein